MELIPDQAYAKKLLSRIRVDTVGTKPLPHLTELIYCLTKSYWSRRDTSGLATFLDDKTILIFALGRGLEEAMLRPSGQPKRGIVDGIHFEVDCQDDDGLMVEFKTTRMGNKRIVEKGIPWGWQRQILGYMKIMEKREAQLAICHIIPAELNAWRVKVSQEDLDLNWQWLLDRRKTYMNHIETGEPPLPFTYNEAYECEGCAFKILCDIEASKLGIEPPEVANNEGATQ